MQRDQSLTFCEIHGDKEHLLSSIEEIIDTALIATPENEPSRLRFVTPLRLETGIKMSLAETTDSLCLKSMPQG